MRIGVDATCWSNRRGYGRFTRALLNATVALDRKNEYVFFSDLAEDEFPVPGEVEMVRIAGGVPTIKAAGAQGSRSLRDMWAISRAISSRVLDAFFFPSVYSYVPLSGRVPQLVTIHDVIPEKFPALVFPNLRAKLFWRAKVSLACMQARFIVTISEYSRTCLEETLRIPASRLRVVHEASDPAFHRTGNADAAALWETLRVPAGSQLAVYVGGFSPHKNLPMLVEVFREVHKEFPGLYLVFAGDYQGDVFFSCYKDLKHQVSAAGLESRVLFTGYVRDEVLLALLNHASVLLLPSFCEGFGLPAVEAAACGAPVLATTRSPLRQLLGEGAIALEPEDRAGWREALRRVLHDDDLRARMSRAGMAAAAALSWENAARQLIHIFNEVATHRAAAA